MSKKVFDFRKVRSAEDMPSDVTAKAILNGDIDYIIGDPSDCCVPEFIRERENTKYEALKSYRPHWTEEDWAAFYGDPVAMRKVAYRCRKLKREEERKARERWESKQAEEERKKWRIIVLDLTKYDGYEIGRQEKVEFVISKNRDNPLTEEDAWRVLYKNFIRKDERLLDVADISKIIQKRYKECASRMDKAMKIFGGEHRLVQVYKGLLADKSDYWSINKLNSVQSEDDIFVPYWMSDYELEIKSHLAFLRLNFDFSDPIDYLDLY